MYTQCPDCSTAFRVTADVLKQAAGKVRCGGCGVAFNALEYLSEAMPEQSPTKETEVPLPELTPEPREQTKGPPMAISAERRAALLKTLDELAGSDIRIEDTGVEWRVLDDDDDDELRADDAAAALGVDELLDESPTPVDQFLTKTPNQIEAGEIFEEAANAPAQTPVEELRFDDNTPLPDDFDLDDASSYRPEAAAAEGAAVGAHSETTLDAEHSRDVDDSPVDIALGDPDEWADILGEFTEPPKPYVPPLEAELSALEEVLPEEARDVEPAVAEESETPLDMDTQFALQAEAMGIDLSGMHASHVEALQEDAEKIDNAAALEAQDDAEEAPSPEAEDEPELMDEYGAVLGVAHIEEIEDSGEVPEIELVDESGDTGEVPGIELIDESGDTGEVPGIELIDESGDTGEVPEIELIDESADTGEVPEIELIDESGDTGEVPEIELVDATGEALQLEDGLADEPENPRDMDDEEATRRHGMDEVDEANEAPLVFGSIEKAMAELEQQSDVFDKRFFKAADDGETEFDAHGEDADIVLDDAFERGESDAGDDTPHVVPPQSEEEQTLNLLIDQELLSMAVEDKDGFASTIVVAGEDAEEALSEVNLQQAHDAADAGFESIVMEGEFIRTGLDQEKRKADIAEAAQLAEQARQAREAAANDSGSGRKRGMAAAAVLLALLLVVQVLHQSREALATIPVFNDTVGPLYRAIGMPLSPAWDVTGWRFEARRDILDEETDTLTVISRIGNTSDKALPYPLINMSLTDRFEETVGNKTLDPSDYLTDDLDPRKMVRPGNNFTAVMTIESPSKDATGYKLQACYRQTDAQLRCHFPNFK